MDNREKPDKLKYGWSTGACAAAAAKAAYLALISGEFPDPVSIRLPKGQTPIFKLALTETGDGWAKAGIIKDAGDDPDVTHGALICAKVQKGSKGVSFKAGEGVGTVTKPGLPVPPGEPAINPVPRKMISEAVQGSDVSVEISVPGGERIALKTLNQRLGIVGGISILGTTGIVKPYSCSAWIHAIHSGIDVARASGISHIAACVGSTSERMVRGLYGLPDEALIEMGNFAGGLLKYLRKAPVERVTIAGGFGKISKLAKGEMDLHSKRSSVDKEFLSRLLGELGADAQVVAKARRANSALEILQMTKLPIAGKVAQLACKVAEIQGIETEVLICDREGNLVGRSAQ